MSSNDDADADSCDAAELAKIVDAGLTAKVRFLEGQLDQHAREAQASPTADMLISIIAAAHPTVTQELVNRVLALEVMSCNQLAAVAVVLDSLVATNEYLHKRLAQLEALWRASQQEASDVTAFPEIDSKKGLPS